jgi:hypothetical protein
VEGGYLVRIEENEVLGGWMRRKDGNDVKKQEGGAVELDE